MLLRCARLGQGAETRSVQFAGGVMADYTIGSCDKCNKYGALKDGKCKDCQYLNNGTDVPDFLSKLFHPEEK